jgi:hypothetical protein
LWTFFYSALEYWILLLALFWSSLRFWYFALRMRARISMRKDPQSSVPKTGRGRNLK